MGEVVAIIPAFNEEERIAATVAALRSIPAVTGVCVVDDGSEDETSARAEQAGAVVLRLPSNQGKAAALAAGVSQTQGDFLLFADADLGSSAGRLGILISLVQAGQADMAIAHFLPAVSQRRGGGMGWAKGMAARAIYQLTGWQPLSPLSGQRALRRTLWQKVQPLPAGFGVEVALTIRALQRGFRVVEVPVELEHRVTGWGWRDVVHRGRQWWAIWRAVQSCRREAGMVHRGSQLK